MKTLSLCIPLILVNLVTPLISWGFNGDSNANRFSPFGPGDAEMCLVYSQKSQKLGCPADGFLEKFGRRYCDEFVGQTGRFSAHGQRVLARIRPCLIGELVGANPLTCDNAKTISEQAHISCYVNSGFCDLSLGDRWQIFSTVWVELFDSGFRAAAREILFQCLR